MYTKPSVFCTNPKTGQLYFYLYYDRTRYYLFQQPFRKSVCAFFSHGVYLDDAFNYSRAKRNPQIVKTISKLPYSLVSCLPQSKKVLYAVAGLYVSFIAHLSSSVSKLSSAYFDQPIIVTPFLLFSSFSTVIRGYHFVFCICNFR